MVIIEEAKLNMLEVSLESKIDAYNLFKEQNISEEDYLELKEEEQEELKNAEKEDRKPKLRNELIKELDGYELKEEMKKEYKKIRYGHEDGIKFDIYMITNGIGVIIMAKDGLIEINGEIHKLVDFYTEMEKRTTLINKYIQRSLGLDNYQVFEASRE